MKQDDGWRASWQAAILDDRLGFGVITNETAPLSDELVRRIDSMLCDPADPSSCFHAEHLLAGTRRPNVAALLGEQNRLYVAGRRGVVLAVVAVRPLNRHAHSELSCLCVRADARGQGIGRRLLRLVIATHPRLELSVWQDGEHSTQLGSLYEAHGFKPVGTSGRYALMRRSTLHASRRRNRSKRQ